ncbi:Methyltransferase domain-containing protein [Granulicella pectinivorans]|uniref:Methyltransferase domain-containing protein n=2 Tax=Granulicella pectinivorans TaxID=474950 RepID=A0A1I6MEZ3_9BACT|nr:Methyltransferase domain-containing protein [Granulicella pectinivorans]
MPPQFRPANAFVIPPSLLKRIRYHQERTANPFADTIVSDAKVPMSSVDSEISAAAVTERESLFERWSWFYALCREYLFRDHTDEIAGSLFPSEGPRPGTHVVELGCGPGFYSCRLATEFPGIQTTGIDLSEKLLLRAKLRAARRRLVNCDFSLGDACSLPPWIANVDAIVVSRLFLIVPGREAVLSEIHRVLRPGGRCFIAEPTSGFRTRIPLSCMWILSKLTSSPGGSYREPLQAHVMTRPDFSTLIHSQPWESVDLQYDGWYQYAVCQKRKASDPAAEVA